MITVKIQQARFPSLPGYIIDITERIPRDEIKKLEEKLENDRFSFRANDIDIKNINNADGFIAHASTNRELELEKSEEFYDGRNWYNYGKYGYTFRGAIVYIYWRDEEIYRGYSRPEDISLVEFNPKTVDIRSFNWLKMLEEIELERFEAVYDLDLFIDQINDILQARKSTYRPTFEVPIFDDLAPLEFDLTVQLGKYLSDREITEQIDKLRKIDALAESLGIEINEDLTLDQYSDVWVDPRNNYCYAIKVSDNKERIDVVRIRGQFEYLVTSIKFIPQNSPFTIDEIYDIRFNRQVSVGNDVFSIFSSFKASIGSLFEIDNLAINYVFTSSSQLKYFPTTRFIEYEKILVRNSSIVDTFALPIVADGVHYYTLDTVITGRIRIRKYTSSGAFIGRYDVYGLEGIDKVFAPSLNRLVFLDRSNTWYYLNWEIYGDPPSLSAVEGDSLPIPIDTDGTETIIKAYPIAYQNDALNGKYTYFNVSNLRDLGSGSLNVIFDNWQINDPIWIALSSLYYDTNITIMDILLDICQLTDGVLATREGYLYLYNRWKTISSHTISQDYMLRDKYGFSLSDNRKDEIKLNFVSECLSNPPKEYKYNNSIYTHLLKRYYEQEYNYIWKKRNFSIPLEIGKDINLLDEIIINETKETGVVIEKESNFESGNRMVKLTVEFRQRTLRPREAL